MNINEIIADLLTKKHKVFFTSDTHFLHRNILKYDVERGDEFKTIEDHDRGIIKNWNDIVSPNDMVIHMGDVSWGTSGQIANILKQLNGKKVLVTGNHDQELLNSDYCRSFFLDIVPYLEIYVRRQMICCFHYAIHEWNRCHRGSWHLHGHSHGNDNYNKSYKRLNLGINLWDFKPISFEQVAIVMAGKNNFEHH